VAEQADARDSKSRGLNPCGFDSHLRHLAHLGPVESCCGVHGQDDALKRRVFYGETVSVQAWRWIIQAVVGAAVGLALGFGIGWGFWPYEPTDAAPAALRWDYRENYVIMVATAYEAEGDLELARQRLMLLDPDNPAAPVVQLGERLVAAGAGPEDITRLARLAWAMGVITPPLVPYLEGQP
jgi:hypothetical protein